MYTNNLEDRKKFLRIDDETSETLREFTPLLDNHLDDILDKFYNYILSFPKLAEHFPNDQIRKHARQGQRNHWITSIFAGNFDEAYVAGAVRIAKTHERIGLEPEHYLGGYELAREEITKLIIENYVPNFWDTLLLRGKKKRQSMQRLLEAIDKAIFLDIGLVIDVYFNEVQKTSAAVLNDLANEFEGSVATVVSSVAQSALQMKDVATSMTAAADNSSRQANIVARAANEASSNVQTVASASQELSSSINEISEQVSRSNAVAQQAVQQASNTNEVVTGLANTVQKIGEIVSMINDIADQTNLLALNATIESARAGEAGKGFAVVAGEVKNLAQQTAKATDEISTQIRSVQLATSQSVEEIKQISTIISSMEEIATTIASAVEEQGAATTEISRNVQEAADGTSRVTENISAVSDTADETGKSAVMVLQSADGLTHQADDLGNQVASFLKGMRLQTDHFKAA